MTDLAAFITTRLDEEEAAAKGPPGWKLEHWTAVQYKTGTDSGREWRVDAEPRCIVDAVAKDDAIHIARHDPARVLREVEAKRAILAEHAPCYPTYYPTPSGQPTCGVCHSGGFDWDPERWPCITVRALAAIWNDHPDYDPDWTP